MQSLTRLDAYAISRALVGLDWREFRISPWVELLLNNLGAQAKDRGLLTRILGQSLISQVFAEDPNGPPPRISEEDDQVVIPALPDEAQLTYTPNGSGWLDEFTAWSTKRSPMTPPLFLEAGGIWALGLAIARRIALKLHAPIYPHLYILWVAPTSIFKKTTGMESIMDLVNAAMPHMLLAEDNTPEAFIGSLCGKRPPNFDDLNPYERKIDELGRMYAAQRGILIDEASSLIGASKKDYMQGMMEIFLRLYDAPTRYTRNLRSEGKLVVRDASLCILGATTPRAMLRSTNSDSWETGELARYALLFPDHLMDYDLGNTTLEEFRPPASLVRRLSALHNALPKPPDPLLQDDAEPPSRESIHCHITKDAYERYAAYAKAVTYDMLADQSLDARVAPNYARLHIQAVKIATSLAAIDWVDGGCDQQPWITLDHWARAQHIAEKWRASLHRLLHTLNTSEDSIVESKVLDHLLRYPDGETLREMTHRMRLSRKEIQDALKSLAESALVAVESRPSPRGPAAIIYKAI